MRNLKRVLSLALASVMLLGMMAIGASAADKTAADLTDMDKVTNKDAVSLMVDLGIIVGKPDGSYAPAETVDRATMAKLIYSVLEASTDASAFTGVSSVLTDVKDNWAEGYINYCYSLGIVAGTGNNTFNPNGKVSVVSAAKMLLVSLGYDSKLSKYENDPNWSVNIMKDAQKAGLLSDVSQKTNDELTRDNAAQMIFNTMMAKTVVAETERDQGVEYLKKYTNNDTTLGYETYGLIKVTGTVDSIDSKGNAVLKGTTVKPAIALATKVSGKVAASTNSVGQSVAIYIKGTINKASDGTVSYTFDKIYSSSIAAGSSEVLGTSANGTAILVDPFVSGTSKDLTTNKSANKGFIAELAKDEEKNVTITGYLNGVKETTDTTPANGIPDAVENAAKIKGALVELIDTVGDGYVTVIRVTNYTVATISGDVKTKTVDDELKVTVPGISGLSNIAASSVKGYEDLEKDDVVLWYKNSDSGVYYIEKAEVVSGKVSSRSSANALTINGDSYSKSGLTGTSADAQLTTKWTNFTDEFDFYLDKASNIVAFSAVTDNATTNYAIVLAAKWIDKGDVEASEYLQAKLLLSDGTTEVVTVKTVDGNTAVKANENIAVDTSKAFYTYKTDKNGKYAIEKVTADTANWDAQEIVKGNARFIKDNTTVSANAKTVFIVEKAPVGGDKTYSTYTGYANVPSMASANVVVVKAEDSSVANYVYLTTTSFKGDAADMSYVYIIDPTDYSEVPDADGNIDYYTTKAIVGEDEIDFMFDDDANWATKVPSAGFYDFSAENDVATVSTAKASTVKNVLAALGDGILDNGTTVYTLDDDSIIYLIEDDAVTKINPDSYTVDNDSYTYTVGVKVVSNNNNNLVEVAYILAVAK